jgi:uncharacterized membrane protein YdjX (TVP38/TMEM64 family)
VTAADSLVTVARDRRTRRVALAALVAGAVVGALAAALLAADWLRLPAGPRPWLGVPDPRDPVAVRAWVRGFGPWAPVAFVALQALQVVVAPIPGHVLGLASGYLFGPVAGTAYGLLGAAIGTWVAVVLARRLGRPLVARLVGDDALDRVDDLAGRRGLLALFVTFLVPGLPDNTACPAAGLTDLDVRTVVAVSVVGRAPGYYLSNLAGAGVATGDAALVVAVVGLFVVATALVVRYRRRLHDWLAG